ncbi:MAG: PQQ-binding-like beta-propeller repeat protein [Leadbetterella sp.]
MNSAISFLNQNEFTGIIVLKEGDNLKGIDPIEKREMWKVTFNNSKKSNTLFSDETLDKFEEIQGTPYHAGVLGKRLVIVNTDDGQIILDKSLENNEILSKVFLPESNEYFVLYKSENKVKCFLLNLGMRKVQWDIDLNEAKSSLFSDSRRKNNVIAVDDKLITLFYGKLSCFDRVSGKNIWRSESVFRACFPAQNKKQLIVSEATSSSIFASESLNTIDIETGKKVWNSSLPPSSRIYKVEDWKSLLLINNSKGLNFYDIKTGSKLWNEDLKALDLRYVKSYKDDFLVVSGTRMMIYNDRGEKVWKEPAKISTNIYEKLEYVRPFENRIFYITQSSCNSIDPSTGDKIWKKDLDLTNNRPIFYAFDRNTEQFVIYNDGKLYKFDYKTNVNPQLVAKVSVKHDIRIEQMDVFDWGICLVGPDEVVGLGFDGKLKYHRVYEQPGESNRKAIKLIGMAMGGEASTSSVGKDDWNIEYKTLSDEEYVANAVIVTSLYGLGGITTVAGDVLVEKYKSRFNALKQNQSFVYLNAYGENRERLLIKVRKSDGAEVEKILLNELNPVYIIDQANQDVFCIEKNHLNIYETAK